MELRPHPANQRRNPHAGNLGYRAIVTYENRQERHKIGWLAPWLSLERFREVFDRETVPADHYPYEVTMTHKTLSKIAAKLLIDPPQLIDPSQEMAEATLGTIMTYFEESRQAHTQAAPAETQPVN